MRQAAAQQQGTGQPAQHLQLSSRRQSTRHRTPRLPPPKQSPPKQCSRNQFKVSRNAKAGHAASRPHTSVTVKHQKGQPHAASHAAAAGNLGCCRPAHASSHSPTPPARTSPSGQQGAMPPPPLPLVCPPSAGPGTAPRHASGATRASCGGTAGGARGCCRTRSRPGGACGRLAWA